MTDRIRFDRDGFLREVGLRVKLIRKQRGLTQTQLGEAVGLCRVSISNLERGRQATTLDRAWRIAIILGVKVKHLTPERE